MRFPKTETLFKSILLEMEDYEFREDLTDDEKLGTIKYSGRKVDWYGNPETMIVIHKDDIFSRTDNIFYPKKMKQIKDLIRNTSDKVEILCSYGMGELITFDDIFEQQQAYYNGSFSSEYSIDEPRSIGDEDLDRYLAYDEEYFEEEFDDYYGVKDVISKYHMNLVNGKLDLDDLKKDLKETDGYYDSEEDDDLENFWEDTLQKYLDIENELKSAIGNQEGDLNRFIVQLRDANHRIQGAIGAGEEYVCLNLYQPDRLPEESKGKYQLVKDL